MNYPTHWRLAFFLAFFLHLILWLICTLFLPRLISLVDFIPQPEPMDWVMIEELSLEAGGAGEPSEESEDDTQPEPAPTPVDIAPELMTAVVEAEVSEEGIADPFVDELDKDSELGNPDSTGSTLGSNAGQTMMVNAKLIHEEQPVVGAIPFYGTVNIRAFLDTEGNVYKTEITRGTGNMVYNAVAVNMVKRWKFTPATDINGEPMSTKYICTLYFNGKPHRKN